VTIKERERYEGLRLTAWRCLEESISDRCPPRWARKLREAAYHYIDEAAGLREVKP
jgi:hypothetical protein